MENGHDILKFECQESSQIKFFENSMDLMEIGWRCDFHTYGSGQVPLASCCENGNEPWGYVKSN
jgi:hypothetical protein